LWPHSLSAPGLHHQYFLSLFATHIYPSGCQTSVRTNHGPTGRCSGLANQLAFLCLPACQSPLQYILFWAGPKTHYHLICKNIFQEYCLWCFQVADCPPRSFNVSFPAEYTYNYDASTTNLTYTLLSDDGGRSTEITLSFLSPITPSSTVRQSIPAAYLTVHVTGNTSVGIYIDVNGQWVSGDRGNDIVWALEGHQDIKTWRVQRKVEQLFTEYRDRAEWGSLYFSGPSVG
jgi:Domain of unknown function (DUF5127)